MEEDKQGEKSEFSKEAEVVLGLFHLNAEIKDGTAVSFRPMTEGALLSYAKSSKRYENLSKDRIQSAIDELMNAGMVTLTQQVADTKTYSVTEPAKRYLLHNTTK